MKFSSLVDRIDGGTTSVWDSHYAAVAAKQRGEDVIILSVGDPDFDTPKAVIDTAIDALWAGNTHYTPIKGDSALRTIIAQAHRGSSGQAVTQEHVIVTSGAQNALFGITQCICEAGDEVIVLQPMYVTYQATIQATQATLVPVVLDAGRGFSLDVEKLKQAINANTRAIYFATPNNPTGMVLKENELQAIASLAIQHDLWVVADEVYSDFVFTDNFHHISSIPGMADRTVTIGSMSKSYAMSGWRLGWAIAPTALIAQVEKLSLCMLYGLPGFIQAAAAHALTHCHQDMLDMKAAYTGRRDRLLAAFETIPKLKALRPDAGMFVMVDVRGSGLSAAEFVTQLFDSVGVSVLDAAAFGVGSEGFIRVSYTLDDALLEQAMLRIARFVASLDAHRTAVG